MRFFSVLILSSVLVFSQTNLCGQSIANPATSDYLSFQSGFLLDGYNTTGIRTFFEYEKDLKGNWQYGISYEHSRHFFFAATDQLYELSSNLSLLSMNAYYKLNIIRERLFWTAGIGIGAVHLNWNEQDRVGATVNASLSLNMRLSKRIYLECSPLIVLIPVDRIYFSTMNADHFTNFYAMTFFPFGFKVKL